MADLKAAVHVSAGAVENDDYVDDDTRVVERVHDGAFSEARRLSSPRETVVRVGIESGRNMPSPPFGIQPSGGWSWHVDFGVVGAPASMRRRTPAKCCNGRFAAGFDVEWDASDAVTVSTRHLQSAALNFALFCGLVFVGDVTVDLSLLSAGFRRLDGEYRLADGRGREKGSLQVRIAVDESVTPPPINSADATAWPRPAHYEDAVLTAEAALRSAAALRPPPPVDAVQAAPVSMDAAPEAQPPDDVPDAFAAARLERAEARLFILAQRSLELDLAPDLGLGALRDMLASLDSVQQRLGSLGTAAPPGDQTCAPREDHAPRETSAPREAPAPPPAAVAAAPQRLDYDEVAAAPDSPGRPAKGASAAFASASPPVGAGVAVPAVAVVVVAPVAAPAVAPAAAAPDVAQLEALLEAERAAFRLQLSEEREALRRDKADFDAAQLAAREAAAAAETVAAAQQADREKLEVARDLRDDARRAAEAAASASLQLQEAARHRRDAQIEAERARETRRNDADRAAALAAAQSVQAADALLTARQEAAQAAFANRVTVDDSSSSSSTAPARAPARVASPPKGVSPPKRSQPFENQYQDFAAAETARIARIMRGALHVA
ncbi:hypothetical protein M885DRAFT_9943 [Pelagophyceae sp. CCMP2097]|nr:hypothetical protein M885DRAFT_9943 [Pelagophyceae sp. CCMP2097]